VSVELTALQARVVACLIEKAATTPDNYPLTTNALVAACNQSTNRDPVADYTSRDVDAAMIELRQLELARAVSGVGHRSSKHKHVVGETLGLDGAEVAVLAVLTLRGPQTLNEIATRTERYLDGPEGDMDVVDGAIDRLVGRPDRLVRRLDRRPGEREPRIEQLWYSADAAAMTTADVSTATSAVPSLIPATESSHDRAFDLADRVASLEAALTRQTRRLDTILAELGVDEPDAAV
jgi:uncharacterized protein YceH (UPF0502 family)